MQDHIDKQYREFFKFGVMPFWNKARKRIELHKRPMGLARGLPPITRTMLKRAGGKYYGAGEEQVWWEIYHSQKWKPSTPKEPMETTSWWSYFYGDDEAQQDMQPRQYWEWTRWERAGRNTAKALDCFDENWKPLDDLALKKDAVQGFKKVNGRWIEDPERIAARARLYAKAEYAEAMHLWREYAQRMDVVDLYTLYQEAENEYKRERNANERHRLAIRMGIIDTLILELCQPSDEWAMGLNVHEEEWS